MGSVIDYIECPNCGNEAYNDFYYKTGEEYTNCSHCGYHQSMVIKEESRDKNLDELTDKDIIHTEIFNPYGAYRIKIKDSLGWSAGSLEDESEFNSLKEDIENSIHQGVEVEGFMVSRYINGNIKEDYIIGSKDVFL